MFLNRLFLFFVVIESTGASSEFYDKFTIRYHISLILKSMWESPMHRSSVIAESKYNMIKIILLSILIIYMYFFLNYS